MSGLTNFPEVERNTEHDLVISCVSGQGEVLRGDVERQLLGDLILDSFKNQECSGLPSGLLPCCVEVRGEFLEQRRAGELTAEAEANVNCA